MKNLSCVVRRQWVKKTFSEKVIGFCEVTETAMHELLSMEQVEVIKVRNGFEISYPVEGTRYHYFYTFLNCEIPDFVKVKLS